MTITDILTFDEFRQDWLKRHQGSLIPKPRISSLGLMCGLALWATIAIGAALVSGAHSVPAILETIPAIVPSPFREVLALFGFTIFELLIFAGALYRRETRYAGFALVTAMIGALAANVGSSLVAVAENGGDALSFAVAIILAVIAPLAAFLAGEMVTRLLETHQAAILEKQDAYEARRRDLDATINREYTKYVKSETNRQTPDRQAALSEPVLSVQTDKQTDTRQTGYGYSRTSDGQQRVLAYFDAHPDDLPLPLRTLAERIGVNKDTVNAGRKAWQERAAVLGNLPAAGVAHVVSVNGHKESE